jgi:phospholipid/cholesterol/gamma-HCH transport system substrate-binding protein
MRVLDKRTFGDGLKLLTFIVITSIATAMLAATIGNLTLGKSDEFKAVFSDATGVVKGDDIRIAGVKVGVVREVEIFDRDKALVTFSVNEDAPVTESTTAAIRYRNLVGQRYIALAQGIGGPGELEPGSTIPLERTTPALDLTVLFNGFKPLFAALSPQDVNDLAYELITVFQGEGGTLEALLSHTGAVTNTLADRDEIIGDLITNLNRVLDTVAPRDEQLNTLLIRLREFVGGLSQDRKAILGSLDAIAELSVQTADLVTGIRPSFIKDIKGLRQVATNIDRNRAEVERALGVLPIKLEKIGRTAIYGSWFNFYLCSFRGRVILPGGTVLPVDYNTGGARCNIG